MKTAIVVSVFAALLIGCSPTEGDIDWGPQIQKANDELLNKGNLELVLELFAPNYVSHEADGDIESGPDAIKAFVTSIRTAFPDLKVEVEILVTEGNKVAWLRTHRGTHQGEILGVPASGRLIEWQDMIVTRYEEGKIAEEWGVSDLAGRLQAPMSTDPTDIVAITETWEAALNAKDIDGIVALYTSDARVLPPNAEMASSGAGIRTLFGGMIDAGISGEFTSIGARVSGDIGYDVGTYTFRVDGAVVDKGKWIVTFNRDDGEWRISNDIFNSDVPVAAE